MNDLKEQETKAAQEKEANKRAMMSIVIFAGLFLLFIVYEIYVSRFK